MEFDAERQAALESGARRGQILAESTNFTRDLVNRPANIATPEHLAEQARQTAEALSITVRTVEMHLTNAMQKLGVHSRTEAVVWMHDNLPDDIRETTG